MHSHSIHAPETAAAAEQNNKFCNFCFLFTWRCTSTLCNRRCVCQWLSRVISRTNRPDGAEFPHPRPWSSPHITLWFPTLVLMPMIRFVMNEEANPMSRMWCVPLVQFMYHRCDDHCKGWDVLHVQNSKLQSVYDWIDDHPWFRRVSGKGWRKHNHELLALTGTCVYQNHNSEIANWNLSEAPIIHLPRVTMIMFSVFGSSESSGFTILTLFMLNCCWVWVMRGMHKMMVTNSRRIILCQTGDWSSALDVICLCFKEQIVDRKI